MKALTENEVNEFLSGSLREWSLNSDFLKRDFKFRTFIEAFSFMTAVALEAEKINHHPDWSNAYNSVIINLRTHDSNGITRLDLDLAQTIDRIFLIYG
jgi:4a-hydroxytetrahydrobiopterin dehydratase